MLDIGQGFNNMTNALPVMGWTTTRPKDVQVLIACLLNARTYYCSFKTKLDALRWEMFYYS